MTSKRRHRCVRGRQRCVHRVRAGGRTAARVVDDRRDGLLLARRRGDPASRSRAGSPTAADLRPLTREEAPGRGRRAGGAVARGRARGGAALALEPARPVAHRARVRPAGKPRRRADGRARRPARSPIRRPSVPSSGTSSHTCGTATSISPTRRSRCGTRFSSSACCRSSSPSLDEGAEHRSRPRLAALALAALVYLTRNAVLRAREVYADVRASVPDGPQGALRRILAGLPRQPRLVWRRLWSVHPDPETRLAAVNDTRRLFPLGLLVAFGTGVATTIAYESLVTPRRHLRGRPDYDPPARRGGVRTARDGRRRSRYLAWSSWARSAEDRAPPSTWPLALALAAGLLVGPELALDRVVPTGEDDTLLGNGARKRGRSGSLRSWSWRCAPLAWVGASAETWIRALAGSPRPARGHRSSVSCSRADSSRCSSASSSRSSERKQAIGASREGGAWSTPKCLRSSGSGRHGSGSSCRDAETLLVLTQPVVFAGLVALWLFPLAAWLWRRDRVAEAPWAFLEPGGRLQVPLLGSRPSLDPWRIGLLAGGVCLVAFLVLRLVLRASVDAGDAGRVPLPVRVLPLAARDRAGGPGRRRRGRDGARSRERDADRGGLAAAFTTGVIATRASSSARRSPAASSRSP